MKKKGMTTLAIQNDHLGSDMVRMARFHCELNIFESFLRGLPDAVAKGELCQKVKPHLWRVMRVYGLRLLSD